MINLARIRPAPLNWKLGCPTAQSNHQFPHPSRRAEVAHYGHPKEVFR